MSDMLRLFVGLRVGVDARAALAREAARLARVDDALRPIHEADMHLTLQFLGDTPRARVAALEAALTRVAAGHAPLDVRYLGLGVFPERGPASVLWAGVGESPPGGLAALAAAVGRELEPLGWRPERRPYLAHVSLARVRRGRRLAPETLARVAQSAALDLGTDRLSDLKLIVSLGGQAVYAYNDLTSHPLGGGP